MTTIGLALAATVATTREAGEHAFLLPFLALMSIQVVALGCAVRLPARIGDAA